jgi:hypothetical protein
MNKTFDSLQNEILKSPDYLFQDKPQKLSENQIEVILKDIDSVLHLRSSDDRLHKKMKNLIVELIQNGINNYNRVIDSYEISIAVKTIESGFQIFHSFVKTCNETQIKNLEDEVTLINRLDKAQLKQRLKTVLSDMIEINIPISYLLLSEIARLTDDEFLIYTKKEDQGVFRIEFIFNVIE